MSTATIRIQADTRTALRAAAQRLAAAVHGSPEAGDADFSFASAEQLFSALTPARWALIERLQALGPSPLPELARLTGRNLQELLADATALLDIGLIDHDGNGEYRVSFDTIHVDLQLGVRGLRKAG